MSASVERASDVQLSTAVLNCVLPQPRTAILPGGRELSLITYDGEQYAHVGNASYYDLTTEQGRQTVAAEAALVAWNTGRAVRFGRVVTKDNLPVPEDPVTGLPLTIGIYLSDLGNGMSRHALEGALARGWRQPNGSPLADAEQLGLFYDGALRQLGAIATFAYLLKLSGISS